MIYRLRQGMLDILAFARQVDTVLVKQYLSLAQFTLFSRMTKSEQLHSINVLRTVLRMGDTPHDLAVACLLHDVGKSRHALSVLERTIVVVVAKLTPRLERKLSALERFDWLHAPFVVRRYHPRWSGEMLKAVGSTERAIWLATHHADNLAQWQDHPHYGLLARLKQADNAN
jgi:hypothetical protein